MAQAGVSKWCTHESGPVGELSCTPCRSESCSPTTASLFARESRSFSRRRHRDCGGMRRPRVTVGSGRSRPARRSPDGHSHAALGNRRGDPGGRAATRKPSRNRRCRPQPVFGAGLRDRATRRRGPIGVPNCSKSASTTARSSCRRFRPLPRGVGDRPQDRGGLVAARAVLIDLPWASSHHASGRCWPKSLRERAIPRLRTRSSLRSEPSRSTINAIFMELNLAGEEDVAKRVKAALTFLAAEQSAAPADGR